LKFNAGIFGKIRNNQRGQPSFKSRMLAKIWENPQRNVVAINETTKDSEQYHFHANGFE